MGNLFILIVFLIIGGLLAAFGLFFIHLGRLAEGFDRQIAADGVDGEAEVTDHRTLPGRGSSSYYVSFRYTVTPPGGPPQTLTTETEISGDDYQRLSPGDKLPIRYLPTDPQEVILAGAVRDRTTTSLLITGYGALAIGAAAALFGVIVALR
jgi:hypothetical protein